MKLDDFKFEQETDGVSVVVRASSELSLPDLIKVFRSFCLAVGYAEKTVDECLMEEEL